MKALSSIRRVVSIRKSVSFFLSLSFLIFFCVSFSVAQQQVARETDEGTKFWAYTPLSYSAEGPGAPLLICLHGGSGIGDDLTMLSEGTSVNNHFMPARIINGGGWPLSRPFVVVSPQLKRDLSIPNYNNQTWPPELIDEVIKYVQHQYNIDHERIYLTGISLGGAGAWTYAANYPEKVAAIVPFSGVTKLEESCRLTDLPIWAFHGDNDNLVDTDHTINMVEAISECPTTNDYKVQLTLLLASQHEGWSEVYTGSTGYDIYSWMLKFRKGNTQNTVPFVKAGGDLKVLQRTGPFYLFGDYFDSDGSIISVNWTQPGGNPLSLEGVNTNILKVNSLPLGNYVFRLQVTDNDGATAFDDVAITVVSSDATEITSITLTDGDENVIRNLTEDDVIDFSELGTNRINLVAVGNAAARSAKFSFNAFEYTRLPNIPTGLLRPIQQDWKPAEGVYRICATAYPSNGGNGTAGISLCFKVSIGSKVYYAKAGSDIGSLASWGTNQDGTGAPPASFTAAPHTFIVPATATLSSQTSIHEDSKLIVAPGGTIIFNNRFLSGASTATFSNIFAEGNGTLQFNTPNPGVKNLSAESTTIFESNAITTVPTAIYGNLILRGSGQKTMANGATVTVRRNFTIAAGTPVVNSGGNSAEYLLLGDLNIQGGTFNPARGLSLRFGGKAEPILNCSPPRVVLRNLKVHSGSTLHINNSAAPGILEISPTGGFAGDLIVEEGASLKLNGHTLVIRNDVAINELNQTGTIDLENSLITFEPNTTRDSNLYPKQGSHALNILETNIQGGGSLHIRAPLEIKDYVRTLNGTIHSNGFLTLVSTAQKSASVATRSGTGTISGSVNVERMVQAVNKQYKYFGVPVKNFTVAGLQAFFPVTGPFTNSSTGYSSTPSLYYYNEPAGGWIGYPTTTNAAPLEHGKGYSAFLRDGYLNPKIIFSGELHHGDFSFVLTPDPTPAANPVASNDGWNLLGNPYASSIRWQATGWNKSGINSNVSIRDNDYAGGRFMVFDGVSIGNFSGVIASGQSFWVQAISATPSLQITENAKVLTAAEYYRTSDEEVSVLQIDLKQNGLEDNLFIKFSDIGSTGFDNLRDAVKQQNAYFNISTRTKDGVSTAIKNLSDTLCSQEVGLFFEPGGTGTFTLSALGSTFDLDPRQFRLTDHHLDSTITLQRNTDYIFNVDNNASSSASDRFSLTIESNEGPELTVSLQNSMLVSSYKKGNQWILNGQDIPGATGPAFEPVEEGDYQVRVTDEGCSKTSGKFAFRITGIGNLNENVSIYPNPATNQVIVAGLAYSKNQRWQITGIAGSRVGYGLVEHGENGDALVSFGDLAPGVYILYLESETAVHQFKLFIRQ